MNERLRIEEPEVKRDGSGTIVRANIVFGPHHFFEVFVEDGAVPGSRQFDVGNSG